MRRIALMIAGLVLITVAVYWRVYCFPFISFDDRDYIFGNMHVQQGFSVENLHWAFVSYTGGNWNPLLWISFFIDRMLFHAAAGPMHVENVVWHLISGLLLWWFLWRATGSVHRSYIVAALFLCHPMHVESVVWISERKDVLSTPFLIAAMLCYVHYTRAVTGKNRWIAYALTVLLYAVSLMIKTMGITLPAVLLLLDFWPLRRWCPPRWTARAWIFLVIEKIPLMLVSLAMVLMGVRAQRYVGAATSLMMLSGWNRASNAIVCYVLYAAKLVMPYDLAILYPHPGERPAASIFASLLLLVMVSCFVFRLRRKFPYLLVGWLWFMGTLVPVIGLFQVGSQAMADRYSYFPSIGLFVMLVWGGSDFLSRLANPLRHRKTAMILKTGLIAVIVVIFTAAAHIQVGYWKDSESLFRHDLEAADDNAPAHIVLGGVFASRGDIKGAVDEFNAALKLGPNARAYFSLANSWKVDDPVRARKYYLLAVEMDPRNIEFHIGYADALLANDDKAGAKQQIQQAMELDPADAGVIEERHKIETGAK